MNTTAQFYYRPMHRTVRQPGEGKCPRRGMALVPEGSRFGIVRHMLSSPCAVDESAGVRVMINVCSAVMNRPVRTRIP
jgi:Heavy metal binding domain